MRWSYLIPRLVILGLIWSFFVWAFDPILRWTVAKTGGQLNGAKVDVAELETRFFPPALELTHVEIADKGKPGRNLVEFETFRLKLAGGPLAHRKLVIEEGEITGLSWNTRRSDSGELGPEDKLRLDDHVQLEELRKKVSQLGKTWLNEAALSAKSGLDPKKLETVQVSLAFKGQWLKRFEDYEAKLKDIETRVKSLKDLDPKGSTLEKIEGYRQAAIQVQKLIAEAKLLRQELAQMSPAARTDLEQIELARERDLKNIQKKLDILKLDKDAISEALLGPELLNVLEDAMNWVNWTREKTGQLTAVKEPVRSRGLDVPFPKPEDPHPGFLIQKLKISGKARVNGEMVPYAGTIQNITSDPKRWGQPVRLELTTDGRAKLHLTATIDQTAAEPIYDLELEYRLPQPTEMKFGDGEKLAFRISSQETTWSAKLKLAGEELTGRVAFLQEQVCIEPRSSEPDASKAAVRPVSFEWNPQEELHRALAGVFGQVSSLSAEVQLKGTIGNPAWALSSNLGPQVKEGLEQYLAAEFQRRQAELTAEVQQKVDRELADFRGLLTEKFRVASVRLNLTESEAGALVQKFAGRPLDLKGLFR